MAVVRLGAACRSLYNNQLSALPTGVFDGLTALTDLYVAQERAAHAQGLRMRMLLCATVVALVWLWVLMGALVCTRRRIACRNSMAVRRS